MKINPGAGGLTDWFLQPSAYHMPKYYINGFYSPRRVTAEGSRALPTTPVRPFSSSPLL